MFYLLYVLAVMYYYIELNQIIIFSPEFLELEILAIFKATNKYFAPPCLLNKLYSNFRLVIFFYFVFLFLTIPQQNCRSQDDGIFEILFMKINVFKIIFAFYSFMTGSPSKNY